MTKLSWPRANAYKTGQQSWRTQQDLHFRAQRQATSARQIAAAAYRAAAEDYQMWRSKLNNDPDNRLLRATVNLKYQRRTIAYNHWAEAKKDQDEDSRHRTTRFT